MPKYDIEIKRLGKHRKVLLDIKFTTTLPNRDSAFNAASQHCKEPGKYDVKIRGRRQWYYEIEIVAKPLA